MKNFKKISLLGALALSALPIISSDTKNAALFAATVTGLTVGLQNRALNPSNQDEYSTRVFTEIVNPVFAGAITAGAIGTYVAAKSSNPKTQTLALCLGVPAVAFSAISWMRVYSHADKCFSSARQSEEEKAAGKK